MDTIEKSNLYLAHHGIKGQKWGVRRYQNEDGSLTAAGKEHRVKREKGIRSYIKTEKSLNSIGKKYYELQRQNVKEYEDYYDKNYITKIESSGRRQLKKLERLRYEDDKLTEYYLKGDRIYNQMLDEFLKLGMEAHDDYSEEGSNAYKNYKRHKKTYSKYSKMVNTNRNYWPKEDEYGVAIDTAYSKFR